MYGRIPSDDYLLRSEVSQEEWFACSGEKYKEPAAKTYLGVL